MLRVWSPAVLLLGSLGCSANSARELPASRFCEAMAQAACDWLESCSGSSEDRATCIAGVMDVWDGCPPAVDAIAGGEVRYHEDEAQALLDRMRAEPCASDLPTPDVYGVLEGTLSAGATCHSDLSCHRPLRCNDFSLATPVGTCGVDPNTDAQANPPATEACDVGATSACGCPDGASGTQRCQPGGSFSPCVCSAPQP